MDRLLKLTFTGDIMLPNEIIDTYKTENNNFNFDSIFQDVKSYFNDSDYVVGNLETPISKNYDDIKYMKYKFTSPIEFAESIKNSGFNFVTTANNHCLDNGESGIEKTISCLNEVGLKHTGVFYKNDNIEIINLNNIKIAILSYTYGTNAFSNKVYIKSKDISVNLLQEQELSKPIIREIYYNSNIFFKIFRKICRKLKLFQLNKQVYERKEFSYKKKKKLKNDIKKAQNIGADLIVMCMHEGGQYNLKPIKKAIDNAKFIQKLGVNLIIGNHEHLIQRVEINNGKVITYCLGNFLGINGVLREPYDKMSEYSLLFNVYIRKSNITKIEKIGYSIVKIIKDTNMGENALKVKLLFDLIKDCKNENEKIKLMKDNQKIINTFTNEKIKLEDIRKEYILDIKEINNCGSLATVHTHTHTYN